MQGSAFSSKNLTSFINEGKAATTPGMLHALHKAASAWAESQMSSGDPEHTGTARSWLVAQTMLSVSHTMTKDIKSSWKCQ